MSLRLHDVHMHIGLSHVLQGVSLRIDEAEVVGIFGRNGVGKTSIVKTIAGWHSPSAGTIEFRNHLIGGRAPEEIARMGIGLVPEDRRIFPGLTVEDNLKLGLMQVDRSRRKQNSKKIQWVYERFPRLAERKGQLGTTLSGGEQQMLAMARVLVGDPKLLLVDEPTEGLAPMIVNEIFDLLMELKREGTSILLIEQNVQRALKLCDRHYAVERGLIVEEGDSHSIADCERLLKIIAV